ncbi:MAG TPA: Wzz/FepE/Etk N-terminal domain-containing protein, partial [Thermoleophilaceae bacterium]|nr:Wzz/FepE/Etk N-terminal domain-containing protein [Thermoleophilaceae bacterium]
MQTVRERLPLILTTIAVTTVVALLYLVVASKTYEAEADLLVTPVSSDEAFTGLPLIRESSDPTRDVETVARLVTTREVAERAKAELETDLSVDELLKKVEAAPIAQSNLVAVTAKGGSAEEAADIANAFGAGVVANRTEQLQQQIDELIVQLRQRVENEPPLDSSDPNSAAQELSRLETLRAGQDPTLRLETEATPPDNQASPRPVLTIFVGLIGGAVLGIGAAFALQTLDPRLR